MVLNCDIVIASEKAHFALPEVKRGVVAIQGGTLILIQGYGMIDDLGVQQFPGSQR